MTAIESGVGLLAGWLGNIMTENWFFANNTVNYDDMGQYLNTESNYNGIMSVGARYLGARYAIDFGFLSPTVSEIMAITYLS
jgi:hypothetical protein